MVSNRRFKIKTSAGVSDVAFERGGGFETLHERFDHHSRDLVRDTIRMNETGFISPGGKIPAERFPFFLRQERLAPGAEAGIGPMFVACAKNAASGAYQAHGAVVRAFLHIG